MSFVHHTDRLTLRSWTDADIGPFEAALNTDAVTRFLGGLETREQIEAGVGRIRACEAENGFCFWAVERRADTAFLGFCGVKRLQADGAPAEIVGKPEIGWRLREDSWGQGYAREAAAASLDLAFGRFGLTEVYAMTMAANAPSWGLMRRLGMIARPDLDFDMAVHGRHVVYRIGREQWTASA